ncbi:MAG: hypothetical protein E7213_09110 [Clostridium sp.]|nr:hypothetical protein [Clostridium sp.]
MESLGCKKKRILILNLPYSGHVNPTLGLTSELVKRGYEVGYINEIRFKSAIEKTGAKFISYKDYPNGISDLKMGFDCYKAAFDTALSIKDNYDIFVYENWFYYGLRTAEILDKPCIRLFSNAAFNMNYINKEIIDKSSIFFHMRYKFVRKLITRLTAKGVKIKYEDMFAEMARAVPDVNIVYTIKEYQVYSEEFDERFKFVGPSMRKTKEDNSFKLENLKKPLIYIAFGTMIKNIKFLKKCIKTFGGKDFIVIISTGNVFDKEKLGKTPDNVHVYSFVPQCSVLEKASLFISHGGQNSVNEAIYSGTPMLILPQGFDCASNADRVESLKLGMRIKNNITEEKLYMTALDVINSKEIAEKVIDIKNKMEETNADTDAADIVENYINSLKDR